MADLPGIVLDSHKNKGLGIQFLKHTERCQILLFILDISSDEPWSDFETLRYEIMQFNVRLNDRLLLIVANKIDLPEAKVKHHFTVVILVPKEYIRRKIINHNIITE